MVSETSQRNTQLDFIVVDTFFPSFAYARASLVLNASLYVPTLLRLKSREEREPYDLWGIVCLVT